jgi:hypothetical protein
MTVYYSEYIAYQIYSNTSYTFSFIINNKFITPAKLSMQI